MLDDENCAFRPKIGPKASPGGLPLVKMKILVLPAFSPVCSQPSGIRDDVVLGPHEVRCRSVT